MTGNYKLETTPQQELEFALDPHPDKTYPGEDEHCKTDTERKPAHGLRRRQKLEEVWRRKHAQLQEFMSAPASLPPCNPSVLSSPPLPVILSILISDEDAQQPSRGAGVK